MIALLLWIPLNAQAQLKGILKRAGDNVNHSINGRLDRKTNDLLDRVEGKSLPEQGKNRDTNNGEGHATVKDSVNTSPANTTPAIYAKYDFVPGEEVVYSNDFADDALGEMPLGWNSNGGAALITLEGLPGKWMQLFKNAFYLSANNAFFTENCTVEFDLLLRRHNSDAYFPQLGFGLMAVHKDSTHHNQSIKNYPGQFAAELKLQPADYGGSHAHYESFDYNNRYLHTEVKRLPHIQQYFNTPIHIALQVQQERLRIWMNERKMYDLPKALKPGAFLNQLFFFVKNNGSGDEQASYAVSNIKIAKGIADTRQKLASEGRFSTTGILFAVGASIIKPESQGTIKEIASVLQQFPEMNIRIVGHTDSDGSASANLLLSQKRAEAVREKADFGVQYWRRPDTDCG
jgi:OOP family OmpA-OmpF porin